MIKRASYSYGARTATITLERIDTWMDVDETVINFPGVVELDGDRLFLTIHWSRHGDEGRGGVEPFRAYLSEDAGATWSEAEPATSATRITTRIIFHSTQLKPDL